MDMEFRLQTSCSNWLNVGRLLDTSWDKITLVTDKMLQVAARLMLSQNMFHSFPGTGFFPLKFVFYFTKHRHGEHTPKTNSQLETVDYCPRRSRGISYYLFYYIIICLL